MSALARPRRGRPFSATAVARLFAATFLAWRNDNAGRMAAALAYYTLFSIPPFLIVRLLQQEGRPDLGVRVGTADLRGHRSSP